jgi:hypothetical protein
MSGTTDAAMSTEMTRLQTVSAACQSKSLMRTELMMTPTEPRASARMCR